VTRGRVRSRRRAGDNHEVASVVGGPSTYRREPCEQCPWRLDQVGKFPAEAFRISAHTAYDAAREAFGCHMASTEKPATCAGFLLRNADNNLQVRIQAGDGVIDLDKVTTSVELHRDYRAMAIANGVSPGDPVLTRCRGNGDPAPLPPRRRGART
jgi:hypothetical protein